MFRMCATRVGRAISTRGKKARIRFFDGRTSNEVDISVSPARRGSCVETFGNVAPSVLGLTEAKRREAVWQQIKKVAAAERLEVMTRDR